MKARTELFNIYLKEQTEYIQEQINTVWNSVEEGQFRRVW